MKGLLRCGRPSRAPDTDYDPNKPLDYPAGAQVTYRCNNGSMIGNAKRKCGANGQWTGETPICRQCTT